MTANDIPVCSRCGERHVHKSGTQSCTAHRRDGVPCKMKPQLGLDVCRLHGGSTPNAVMTNRKAFTQMQLDLMSGEIAQLMDACDIPQQHPLDGLLEVVRHSGAMMRMLGGLIGELAKEPGGEQWAMSDEGQLLVRKMDALWGPDHKGDAKEHILVALYGLWSDRYARACKLALDANIDERLVRNAEATSDAFLGALTRALAKAGLTKEQSTILRTELASELRSLGASL